MIRPSRRGMRIDGMMIKKVCNLFAQENPSPRKGGLKKP